MVWLPLLSIPFHIMRKHPLVVRPIDISVRAFRYVKFDTFHPAVDKGLPVTRVVSRVALQGILADACMRVAGSSVICNDCHVVDYEEKASHARMQVRSPVVRCLSSYLL